MKKNKSIRGWEICRKSCYTLLYKALPMENYAPIAVPQPKMDPTDLIHMENLLQRNCYGRIIGIHLYDVGHIVPPFLYNWVETHVLRRFLAFGFLAYKQDVGVAIPID